MATIILAWLPYLIPILIQLVVAIWLTLKLIGVLRTMAAAQQGILAKLNDIDLRLAATGVRPPDPR